MSTTRLQLNSALLCASPVSERKRKLLLFDVVVRTGVFRFHLLFSFFLLTVEVALNRLRKKGLLWLLLLLVSHPNAEL